MKLASSAYAVPIQICNMHWSAMDRVNIHVARAPGALESRRWHRLLRVEALLIDHQSNRSPQVASRCSTVAFVVSFECFFNFWAAHALREDRILEREAVNRFTGGGNVPVVRHIASTQDRILVRSLVTSLETLSNGKSRIYMAPNTTKLAFDDS